MECPLGSVRICRQLNELAVNSDEINLFEAASPTARGIAAPGSSPGPAKPGPFPVDLLFRVRCTAGPVVPVQGRCH